MKIYFSTFKEFKLLKFLILGTSQQRWVKQSIVQVQVQVQVLMPYSKSLSIEILNSETITKNKRNQLCNKNAQRLVHIVLESCYTKCLKTFFGYHKYMYSSVTSMLMELGIPSFSRPTLIHSYYSSFQNRLKTSGILVKHIVAFNLWYQHLYSFYFLCFSVLYFFIFVCPSVCLIVFWILRCNSNKCMYVSIPSV